MKSITVGLACFAFFLGASNAESSHLRSYDEHPIEKVIGLIQDLIEKVEQEGKSEEISFAKFDHWSANSVAALDAAVQKEKATIDALESKIESKSKEETELELEIAALEEQIGQIDATSSKADGQRTEDANLYGQTKTELERTIAAIGRALTLIEDAKTSTAGASMLLAQKAVQKVVLLAGKFDALITFLKQDPPLVGPPKDEEGGAAPAPPPLESAGDEAAHVQQYKFKSDNIIEILKQLSTKFEEELLEAEKAETNSLNAYALSKQARDFSKSEAIKSKEGKSDELSDVQSELATARQDLSDTKADLEADSDTLATTKTGWETKKSEWSERQKLRENEVAAMHAAIEILSKATGVSTEAPSNPVPPPSPIEFVSTRMSLLQIPDPKMKAVNLLRAEAHTLHSKALERMAQQIAAHLTGPFDEVKQMIQKMIFRLMAEQKDEDDHKNWCDLELQKTNVSKADKEDKIEELDLKINDANAMVMKLTEDIKAADDMVSKLTTHMEEATEIRDIGKKENALAVQDAKDAQRALTNAIAVIEAHYKESGMVPKESYEFLQGREPVTLPESPETWSSPYTGVADPKAQPDGIIAVLEGVLAKFTQMESDTKVQETEDQKAYDDDMQSVQIEKARRSKESEMKQEEKKRLIDKVSSFEKRKKSVSGELESVEIYLKDLEPACVEGDSTYEERKAARTQEVEALKEAQVILTEAFKAGAAPAPAAAFLQVRRHHR